MRVLLPLLLIACAACHNSQEPAPAPSEARFHWPAAGLVDGYVPGEEEYHLLDDGRLAFSNRRAFVLDVGEAGAQAHELKPHSSTDTFLDVVRWKGGLVWLRRDKSGKLSLDAERGAGADPLGRPKSAVDSRPTDRSLHWIPAPRLAADRDLLVLFCAPLIHRYENGAWTSVQLDLGSEKYLAHPARALLVGRKLFLGTDRGEFGGQLIVADIDTGKAELECRKWSNGPWNVADIDRGPDGTVYVTCGYSHMGLESSALMAFDGAHWSRLLWSSAKNGIGRIDAKTIENDEGEVVLVEYPEAERDSLIRSSIVRGADETSVASADFRALAFDDQGRMCLLSSWLGLLRRDTRGDWTWLTPGWPRKPAWVTDLAIVDGKALISATDAGVIVVDLQTLAAERVRLK